MATAVMQVLLSADSAAVGDAVSGVVWVFVGVAVVAAAVALGGLLVLVRRGNRRD
ncbi:hypothetical protein ACIQLJ_14915 [Microbacterium sp. NPDC091313]